MTVLLGIVVGAAVFLATRFLSGRRTAQIERRVSAHVQRAAMHVVETASAADVRTGGTLDSFERALARHRTWQRFEARAARAGVDRRPIDLALGVAGLSLLLALLGALAGSVLIVLVGLVAPAAATWAVLGALAQRRLRAFEAQLPDILSALGSSLRAGHGFLQSLQAVAQDAPEPAGGELRRALAETRVGRPVDEALAGVVERVPSRDFEYVLTAIAVQRQAGGSLAGLFEIVNETVRSRQQFTRKVRALTATGRMSAYTLIALPFGVACLLSAMNHSYLTPLFHSHFGRVMLVFGACSMAIGTAAVNRIVSFKG